MLKFYCFYFKGSSHSVTKVWIKTEPVDIETSAYFDIKCEDGISVVKVEPSTDSVTTEGLFPETVSIKSETTIGDNECTPLSKTMQLTKKTGSGKRFSCSICGASFAQKQNLEYHQRKHTGERPFSCDICGNSFFRKTILDKHIFLHSGEKPYSCDICGIRFAQKGHVKQHKQKHIEKKMYSCDACGKKFKYQSSLNKHTKTKTHIGEQASTIDVLSTEIVTIKSEITLGDYECIPSSEIVPLQLTTSDDDERFIKSEITVAKLTHDIGSV